MRSEHEYPDSEHAAASPWGHGIHNGVGRHGDGGSDTGAVLSERLLMVQRERERVREQEGALHRVEVVENDVGVDDVVASAASPPLAVADSVDQHSAHKALESPAAVAVGSHEPVMSSHAHHTVR